MENKAIQLQLQLQCVQSMTIVMQQTIQYIAKG